MKFRLLTVEGLRKWNLGFEILRFGGFVPFVLIAHRRRTSEPRFVGSAQSFAESPSNTSHPATQVDRLKLFQSNDLIICQTVAIAQLRITKAAPPIAADCAAQFWKLWLTPFSNFLIRVIWTQYKQGSYYLPFVQSLCFNYRHNFNSKCNSATPGYDLWSFRRIEQAMVTVYLRWRHYSI